MTAPEARKPVMASPAIWGNVPARNKNFTGRKEILELLRQSMAVTREKQITAVLPGGDTAAPLPQAFQGLGGVGKTAIAIEYVYRHRADYDIVWWIAADQLSSVRRSLADLAKRLNLETAATAGVDGAIQAALDALRRGEPFGRWLLVFDNADQPRDIWEFIPTGPGDVLITSRNYQWQSVINTVPMDVFARPESREFLRKRVNGLSEQDADRLAQELGDLPLALEQAGAMLSETGMPADEYLRLLKEHVSRIMDEGKSPDYPMSMSAAWRLSVSTLHRQLPDARELLRCCAFFGPEPIPRDVFRRGSQAVGTSLASVIADPVKLPRAFHELGRFALVKLDGTSIAVHRLIQALVRDELTTEEREHYRHEVHLILAAAAPEDPDEPGQWGGYRDLLPHVASDSTEFAKSSEPAARELALSVMRYLYQSGDYSSCIELTESFIDQWTKDAGPDSVHVLRAQRHLGNALRLLGRYPEAFKITEATLARSRAKLGDSESLTLYLRNSFGADLRAAGDFRSARVLDEETRTLLESTLGPEHPRTQRLLSSIALDYGLNSDYHAANSLYQQVFRLMSAPRAGTTATDVIGVWIGLAWALRLIGDYREALDVTQEALDYAREKMGPEHIATLRTVNAYTIVCRRFPDEREEGLEISQANLELARRLFGDNHPDTLAIAISLSNTMRASKKSRTNALALAEDTVARYPEAYGRDHPYYYGTVGNLAVLKRVAGDATGACELNRKALDGLTGRLGMDHHYTLTVATNLASDLAALGQLQDARDLGQDTLRRLRDLLGHDHPSTLGCAANLALDVNAAGDAEAGDGLKTDTMARYERTLGKEHPDTETAEAGRRLDPDFDPPPI